MARLNKTISHVMGAGFIGGLIVVGGVGHPQDARAVTTTWTDTNGGDFPDAANWDNGVPGNGDDAVFDANATYTVTITSNVESDSLDLLDGRVTLFSPNATAPTYTLDPASSFSTALLVSGNVFDSLFVNNVELLLDGDVRVTDRSTLNVSGGGKLTPLNFGFDMVVGDSSDSGTATFSGAGTTLQADRIIIGSTDHQGVVSFSSGATGSSDDNVSISRGSLNLQSGSTFDVNRSLFVGNSTVGFSGASVTVSGGAVDISTLNLNDFSSLGSEAGNAATLVINNNGVVSASDTLVLNNTGEMDLRNGGMFNTNRSVSVSGGLMHVNGGEANLNGSSANISVINGGLLQITNGGVVNHSFDPLRIFDGTVRLFDGTLSVQDVSFFDIAGKVDFDFGTLRFTQSKTFSGPDIQQLDFVTLSGGKNLEVSGTATLQGEITVAGGRFAPNTLVADSAFNLLGGTVDVVGAATLNGQAVMDGGVFDADSMNVSASFDLLRGTVSMPGTLTLNPGAVFLVDGGTLNAGSIQNPSRLDFRSGTVNLWGDDFIVGEGDEWGGLVRFGAGQTFLVPADSSEVLSNGTLLLEGGKLGVDTLFIEGLVHMSGVGSEISGDLIQINGGELAGHGRIATSNGVENMAGGRITLTGGELKIDQFLFNEAGGLVTGNGTLRVNGTPAITNDGNMVFSGLTNIIGNVTNNSGGTILSTGGGPLTFFDDVDNQGEVHTGGGSVTVFLGSYSGDGAHTGTGEVVMQGGVQPGNSPATIIFGGDLTYGPATALEIEIAGTTPGSEFDTLDIAGLFTADGTLDVLLISAFMPSDGDSFDIFDFGSITGSFSAINLPALAGNLDWDTSNLLIDGTLSVFTTATLPGDLDGDGFVGINDLNIVLGNWNQNVPPADPLADPSGDGFVGIDDLNAILGNWNAGTPPNATTNIPEPGVVLMLAAGALGLAGRRR